MPRRRDVIVFESLRFLRPRENDRPAFQFKNASKSIRFYAKTYTCGRGLRRREEAKADSLNSDICL